MSSPLGTHLASLLTPDSMSVAKVSWKAGLRRASLGDSIVWGFDE